MNNTIACLEIVKRSFAKSVATRSAAYSAITGVV